MDKDKLRRYQLAVYLLIGLLALILFLISNFVITEGIFNDLLISMSSELLGVAVIFFIINRIFLIDDDNERDQKLANSLRYQQKTILRVAEDIKETRKLASSLQYQQQAILKVVDDVREIRQATFFLDQIKIMDELSVIRRSLGSIDENIDVLTRKITMEFQEQQKHLLWTIEREFTAEIDKSHENLRLAIERELATNTEYSTNQNSMVERLVTLVEHAIRTMGNYQRASLQEESDRIFSDMLNNIQQPIAELSKEVENLHARMRELPLSLPSPENKKR